MPEWLGLTLKLLGALGSACFGILGLGTKARNDSGDLTPQGRTALIGLLVSAVIASGSAFYDFFYNKTKEVADATKSEQARLDTQRMKYPLKGLTAEVVVEFPHDFPALDAYKAKLSAALPKGSKDCKNTKLFECVGSDDDEIIYGIPASSPLYPKSGDPMRRVLDRVSVSVGFIKPGHGFGDNLPFHPVGSFSFRPAQLSAIARFEYNPRSKELSYYVSDIKIPDEAVIRSGLYSLADVFPGVMTAEAIVMNYPPICELPDVPAERACEAVLPYTALRFARVSNLGLQFPYPKQLGVDAISWSKCTSFTEGDVLLRAPRTISKKLIRPETSCPRWTKRLISRVFAKL